MKVRDLQEVLHMAKHMRAGAYHFAKHAENVDEAALAHCREEGARGLAANWVDGSPCALAA